ncbi:MAG: transposase, partial [Candidatus Tectomicrobia bacterium]|nr:transposase [Candidatus Tectomicrobia bacterium]
MARPVRSLQPDFTYHITMRCNNRRFNLNRKACREVLLYAIERAQSKYSFTLYALCIM